ncbi:hypothetical protein LCGC14_2903820 [marine sediment metagenome]|uniref:Uncharacterized protein n=1 Tax=marine sediment metagenome TaxID=412755 RepID=A0A0F8XTM4_9ZZZZ
MSDDPAKAPAKLMTLGQLCAMTMSNLTKYVKKHGITPEKDFFEKGAFVKEDYIRAIVEAKGLSDRQNKTKNAWWMCVISIWHDNDKNHPVPFKFVTTDQIDDLVNKFDGKLHIDRYGDNGYGDGDDDYDYCDIFLDPCDGLDREYGVYKIPLSKYKELEKTSFLMEYCTQRYTDNVFLSFIKQEPGDSILKTIEYMYNNTR